MRRVQAVRGAILSRNGVVVVKERVLRLGREDGLGRAGVVVFAAVGEV